MLLISDRDRAIAYVLGIALLAAGTVATFVPWGREWGAVALIAVGGIILLLAVIGRFPSSMRAGGVDLTFEDTEDIAETLADIQTPAVRDYLARWFVRITGDATIATRSSEEAKSETDSASEAGLADAAMGILKRIPGMTVRQQVSVPGPGKGRPLVLDAVLTKDARNWVLEVDPKFGNSRKNMTPLERLGRAMEYGEFAGGLLVVNDKTASAGAIVPKGVQIVDLDGLEGLARLL